VHKRAMIVQAGGVCLHVFAPDDLYPAISDITAGVLTQPATASCLCGCGASHLREHGNCWLGQGVSILHLRRLKLEHVRHEAGVLVGELIASSMTRLWVKGCT
jgi:hypothetical protein